MNVNEVGLLTDDVIRLANFYRAVLKIDDDVHQFIGDTMLTVSNDGAERKGNFDNICIAFTVNDIYEEYERLKSLGVEIIFPPAVRPWGAINMIFKDPDGNQVVFRSLPK